MGHLYCMWLDPLHFVGFLSDKKGGKENGGLMLIPCDCNGIAAGNLGLINGRVKIVTFENWSKNL